MTRYSLCATLSFVLSCVMLLGATLIGATQAGSSLAHPGSQSAAGGLSDRDGARGASDTLVFAVAEEGNEARYRVREQLARLDFPNDAVGATTGLQGRIMVTPDGGVVREGSRFIVDMAGLTSDSDRRDNFLRRNTLRTEDFPEAVFIPTAVRGLPEPLPASGEIRFELDGDFTIRDVTRPVTWEVDAELWDGAVIGQARTRFEFGHFDLEIPSVGSVLSIRDEIRLEYDFRLVPVG